MSLDTKMEQLRLLERKRDCIENLPHLYGQKLYIWQREFIESSNKNNFLCAANQIGKSSCQIRKCIMWATDKTLWPKLWATKPLTFWYLYPSGQLATVEVKKKWIPEFLPRGEYANHPVYGWKLEERGGIVQAIHFNSGVSVYFKTYSQHVDCLQAGTVWAIFADEEIPYTVYPEVNMRRTATNGYFHMVFTATLGQQVWKETLESNAKNRPFKNALRRQVSMYDCLTFEDGSLSHWTKPQIKEAEAACLTKNEKLRRVYGKFVVDSNLVFEGFDRSRNLVKPFALPEDWYFYAGVDPGAGGGKSHPAGIIFVAVAPDFSRGAVYHGWKGDKERTTAGDVVNKFIGMKQKRLFSGQYYDFADADFFTIASRMGEPFQKANKARDAGEAALNTLFKNNMLVVFDIPDLVPLVHELETLTKAAPGRVKYKVGDDMADALRYATSSTPWDFSRINSFLEVQAPPKAKTIDDYRREGFSLESQQIEAEIDEEIDEWNEQYGN